MKKKTRSVKNEFANFKADPTHELQSLQQELLDLKEICPKVIISGEDCLNYARGFAAKAKTAMGGERGRNTALACYYYYFAEQSKIKEAKQERETLQGEWASRGALVDFADFLKGIKHLSKRGADFFCKDLSKAAYDYVELAGSDGDAISINYISDDLLQGFMLLYKNGYVSADGSTGHEDEDEPNLVEQLALCLAQTYRNENENTVYRNLAHYFYSVFYAKTQELRKMRELLGLPSEAAYLIAMAYLEGNGITQINRIYASLFMQYAMLTGSQRACLAWALFFEPFAGEIESGNSDKKLLDGYCSVLYHGLLLCKLQEQPVFGELRCGQENVYEQGGVKKDISLDILLTLTAAMTRLIKWKNYRLEDYPMLLQVVDFLHELTEKYKGGSECSAAIRCCCARLISILSEEEDLSEELRIFASFYVKIKPEFTDEDVAFELIKPYLGKGNKIADQTLLDIDAVALSNKAATEYKRLLKAGESEALSKLAQIGELDEQTCLRETELAAERGNPIAALNVCQESAHRNKNKKGLIDQLIKVAVNGVPQAFFSLYRMYDSLKGKENGMLADTCLRYASLYLEKEAKNILNRKQLMGQYHPLPFMQVLDRLDMLSDSDSTAAVFLGSMFATGMIVPRDPFMSLMYFRQAVGLGDETSVYELNKNYISNWGTDDDEGLICSVQHCMEHMQRYGAYNRFEEEEDSDEVFYLVEELYTELENGKTWLECYIFANVFDEPLWDILTVDRMHHIEDLNDEQKKAACQRLMLDARKILSDHAQYNFTDPKKYFEKLRELTTALSSIPDEKEMRWYKKTLTDLKMLCALRGNCALDLGGIGEYMRDSYNADNFIATVLSRAAFEGLSLKGSKADPAICADLFIKDEAEKKKSPADFINVTVEQ